MKTEVHRVSESRVLITEMQQTLINVMQIFSIQLILSPNLGLLWAVAQARMTPPSP